MPTTPSPLSTENQNYLQELSNISPGLCVEQGCGVEGAARYGQLRITFLDLSSDSDPYIQPPI